MGAVRSTAPTISPPHDTLLSPISEPSATGAVIIERSVLMSSGQRWLFHELRNRMIDSAAIVGLAMGMAMREKICHSRTPRRARRRRGRPGAW